jgi:hypothetical protein
MKYIKNNKITTKPIIGIMLLISCTAQAQHFQDNWQPKSDKLMHFGVGFLIASTPSFGASVHKEQDFNINYKRGFIYGMAWGGGITLLKEVHDYTTNKGVASFQDLTYGVVGSAIGSLTSLGLATLVNNKQKKKHQKAETISNLLK